MLQRADALRVILHQPLDYLHPERGVVPRMFQGPAARAVLNRSLLRGLGLSVPDLQEIERTPWSDLWVAHWRRLPVIARLMGAQLLWPRLARGARMRELDASTRAFARIDLGDRPSVEISEEISEKEELEPSISALGFSVLVAWQPYIPEALMRRLTLQFSPRAVELQQDLPAQRPNPSLFTLAVQHARIHQNP